MLFNFTRGKKLDPFTRHHFTTIFENEDIRLFGLSLLPDLGERGDMLQKTLMMY
jgi:hypothetical protein